MNQFHYEGRSADGQITSGTLAAANADEAVKRLAAAGLSVTRLQRAASAVVPSPTQHLAPSPAAGRPMAVTLVDRLGHIQTRTEAYASPEAAVRAASDALCRIVELTDPATRQKLTVHLPLASNKDRSFAFAQIAELLRAGISPAQVFEEIGSRNPHPGIRDAFLRISRSAVEGGRISDILELYPHTFPASDAGMVRAAEEAGFLPDGCQMVADQAMEAHRFQRFFWFVMAVIIIVVTSIPTAYFGMQAIPMAYDRYEKAGAPPSAIEIISATLREQILGFACPITVGALGILWLLWRFARTPRMTAWRHRIGARAPVWGNRARNENLATFCRTMAHVGHAGVAPYRVWWLSANAVPNLYIRERLLRLGSAMREGTKMSEVPNDGLLPPEFATIVRTGEMTGDMGSSLRRMDELARSSAERAGWAAKGIGCHFALTLMVLLAGFWVILFAYVMYKQLPDRVLQGMEP